MVWAASVVEMERSAWIAGFAAAVFRYTGATSGDLAEICQHEAPGGAPIHLSVDRFATLIARVDALLNEPHGGHRGR